MPNDRPILSATLRAVHVLVLALLALALLLGPAQALASLTITTLFVPQRETLAVTWSQVIYPPKTKYVLIYAESGVAYWTTGCADAAVLGSDYNTIPADTPYLIAVDKIGSSRGTLCIAGSSAITAQITPLLEGL